MCMDKLSVKQYPVSPTPTFPPALIPHTYTCAYTLIPLPSLELICIQYAGNTMKATTLVTALAEKSLKMAYFPGELNCSALRSYFISGEVYDQNIGEITRKTAIPCFITSPKRQRQKSL